MQPWLQPLNLAWNDQYDQWTNNNINKQRFIIHFFSLPFFITNRTICISYKEVRKERIRREEKKKKK